MNGPSLEQQIQSLQQENDSLRTELARYQQRAEMASKARGKVIRIGWRVLIPLLDRQKVVRSFARLANTASGFTGPSSHWPTRDQLLGDARAFMEACVRFVIRRRTILILFSLLAATIPMFQLWIVVEQNRLFRNQNKLFEVQVYDIVGNTMANVDKDPNASRVLGALLANSDIELLRGVVEEAFDPALTDIVGQVRDADAAERRLHDAVFRSHLIRGLARWMHQAKDHDGKPLDHDERDQHARPLVVKILRDAASHMPGVLRIGSRYADNIDGEMTEAIGYYLYQVGYLLKTYGQLARSIDEEERFFADIKPLFDRLVGRPWVTEGKFADTYRLAMLDFVIDLAQAPGLGDKPEKPKKYSEALRKGIERLRKGMGDNTLNWTLFAAQLAEEEK